MDRLLLLASCLALPTLGACGSDAVSNASERPPPPGARGGEVVDAGTGDAASDAASDTGASDGAVSGLPAPPAGALPCGQGTITPAAAREACLGIMVSPMDCDAVVISGGEWRAWCKPSTPELYVWARFDGIAQAQQGACAGTAPAMRVGASNVTGGGESGSNGQPHQVTSSPVSHVATYDFAIPLHSPTPSGTGVFGVRALLATAPGCTTTNDPNAKIVSGFHMTWQQ